MFQNLLPGVLALLRQLATDYTTVRAAKLDNLDATISGISPIRTIQSGTIVITNGNGSNTATLGTAVTVAKAVVIHQGAVHNGSTDISNAAVSVTLTNTNTVTANRDGTTGAVTLKFTVVEYK